MSASSVLPLGGQWEQRALCSANFFSSGPACASSPEGQWGRPPAYSPVRSSGLHPLPPTWARGGRDGHTCCLWEPQPLPCRPRQQDTCCPPSSQPARESGPGPCHPHCFGHGAYHTQGGHRAAWDSRPPTAFLRASMLPITLISEAENSHLSCSPPCVSPTFCPFRLRLLEGLACRPLWGRRQQRGDGTRKPGLARALRQGGAGGRRPLPVPLCELTSNTPDRQEGPGDMGRDNAAGLPGRCVSLAGAPGKHQLRGLLGPRPGTPFLLPPPQDNSGSLGVPGGAHHHLACPPYPAWWARPSWGSVQQEERQNGGQSLGPGLKRGSLPGALSHQRCPGTQGQHRPQASRRPPPRPWDNPAPQGVPTLGWATQGRRLQEFLDRGGGIPAPDLASSGSWTAGPLAHGPTFETHSD